MKAQRTLPAQKWRSCHKGSSESRLNDSQKTKAQLIAELRSLSGRVADLEGQGRGQSERDILQTIAEGTSHEGPAFFSSFVRSLTSALGVRYAFVAECLDQPTTKVRTLAFWMGDHLGDNVEYEVEGTPCKETCDGETPFYPRNIQTLFPEDRDLVTLGVESYCGLPLRDASGQVIGHLAILDVNELTENFSELPALRIFTARAAAELERKRAEAEKMDALGQLTAGIAHEMNTPIGVVNSSAFNFDLCVKRIVAVIEKSRTLDEVRADRGFQQSLEIIQDVSRTVSEASLRIAKIISGLKRFSVEESSEASANIRECVESTLAQISPGVRQEITIENRLTDLPAVACGPAAMNQVLMTLLTNAVQAIGGQGKITVETARYEDRARIQICDTGSGIPKEKLKALFDFTFTTKGARVGVGMGLASVYNIIQKCNGDITVTSELGEGTTFTIMLPIREHAPVHS